METSLLINPEQTLPVLENLDENDQDETTPLLASNNFLQVPTAQISQKSSLPFADFSNQFDKLDQSPQKSQSQDPGSGLQRTSSASDLNNMKLKLNQNLANLQADIKTNVDNANQKVKSWAADKTPQQVKTAAKEIEIFFSKAQQWHDAFTKMQFEQRIIWSAGAFVIGISGFCISVFGVLASTFLLMTSIAFIAFLYSFYVYVIQKGILSFMPLGVQTLLTEVSFFDILVNIFIYRRISKMVTAIFSPFFKAETPDQVKEILKQEHKLSAGVYKALFKKGIMNTFPEPIQEVLVPADVKQKTKLKKSKSILKSDSEQKSKRKRSKSQDSEADKVNNQPSTQTPQISIFPDAARSALQASDDNRPISTTGGQKKSKQKRQSSDSIKSDDPPILLKRKSSWNSQNKEKAAEKTISQLVVQQFDPFNPTMLAFGKLQTPRNNNDKQITFDNNDNNNKNNDSVSYKEPKQIIKPDQETNNNNPLDNQETDSFKTDSGFATDQESEIRNRSYEAKRRKNQNSTVVTSYQDRSLNADYSYLAGGGGPSYSRSRNDSFDLSFENMTPFQMMTKFMNNPQVFVQKMASGQVRSFFKQGIRYRTLMTWATVLIAFLLIQLKMWAKTRRWTKTLIQGMVYGGTFFGLVIVAAFSAIKYHMHTKAQKQIKRLTHVQDNKKHHRK